MAAGSEKLISDAREYVDLKIDNLKLQAVEGLSLGAGRAVALMVIMMVLFIVIAAFSFGCVCLLGELVGSRAMAAFIVGGVFLIVLVALFLLRRRMFVDMFVRLFIEVFYEEK